MSCCYIYHMYSREINPFLLATMAKLSDSCCCHFLLALCLAAASLQVDAAAQRTVPAIFIFGDSAVDVGTNNNINLLYFQANYPYHGIDLPDRRPTGRFCNGYNIADHLARLLGFYKSPPAFVYLLNNTSIEWKKMAQRGVNFASAGSGILEESSALLKRIVPLKRQIQQFATVKGNITEVRGPKATAKLLSKALYIFFSGTNDIIGYLGTNSTIPMEEYMATLQSSYHDHLKNMYDMGARKFAIIGVPPIGCCPGSRALKEREGGGDGCIEEANDLAQALYRSTEIMLQRMSAELPEMKYSLGNAYNLSMMVFENHASFGFTEIKTACCGLGMYNGGMPCYRPSNPNLCENRTEYLFWDFCHPTEAAALLLASNLYSGDAKYSTPMNFSRLAELKVHL